MTQPTPMTCAGAAVTLGPENEPPARIELMPTGAFTLRDRAGNLGAINAKVSDPAALIKRSLASATGGMLPIDFAHGLDDLGARDGRAAGWIIGLASEGGKIMADVEWTAAGRAALESKEYRFISPTFYSSENGGEVTRIARAGLTNIPALPELKQVAAAQDTPDWQKRIATLATKLGMPADTDAGAVLTAAETAVDQLVQARAKQAPRKAGDATETPATATGQVGDIDALSKVLATALDLPETATADEIVAALLSRDAVPAVTTAAAQSDQGALIPIAAVANYMTNSAEQRQADLVNGKITAAMQAGKLPPALEGWARDLGTTNLAQLDRFLSSSPFDLSNGLKINGPAPFTAGANAAHADPADMITRQLGLPQGSLSN